MIISNHPATTCHRLQNAFKQVPHPCWNTTWGTWRLCSCLWNLIEAQCETLLLILNHCMEAVESWLPQGSTTWEGRMLTHGHHGPSRGHSAVCDCLTGGDCLFLLCQPDATEILRLWFYIKARIWMKGNRLSNQKEPALPWVAKICKMLSGASKAIEFEVKPRKNVKSLYVA